ncbi:probable mitochondrial-processing peptidase subunit beta, mitochondrial isoform X2 [Malania oleifera]|uniref:probable mitochondrial-processing peptidase subunit beta, mitochondrial isoform X2 n=1 Tax=Malania oleifera TaxID=397392 RepID=UPI0025AE03CC|nr:probable mitochondrial-processing peptidase subunit beta, mitochondrial isoform X2 [Malania oleifera]
MATRRLLNLSRMSNKPSTFTSHSRSTSQSSAVAGQISSPASRSPPVMLYDRLSEEVKFKLRRLENPDQRFLRHASPHPAVADHSAILSSPETRITTLPNGLRVATESDLAARTATVGVWIDSGSRFEGDDANGAAHFLESVIFQGTEKKPAVGNVGGQLNACTCREQTNYCATVMGKDAPKAVDALAGMLQNSSFEQKQIDRLRRLILRRAEDVEGRAKEVVFDHLHATAFQHTPLGRTILGTAESIQTITKAHIQNYVSTHYAAHRMVVVAAGAVKHEEIVERVKQQFTKLSANPVTTTQLVSNEPAVFTGSEVRIIDDYDHIARLAVAFKGASWTDPDSIALMVMQHLLGSWNKNGLGGKHVGSSLGQRVGITGIAESMTAFNTQYKDTGLFGVYAVAKVTVTVKGNFDLQNVVAHCIHLKRLTSKTTMSTS